MEERDAESLRREIWKRRMDEAYGGCSWRQNGSCHLDLYFDIFVSFPSSLGLPSPLLGFLAQKFRLMARFQASGTHVGPTLAQRWVI